MDKLDEIIDRLARLEANEIEKSELRQLGHRIVFDPVTGISTNLAGIIVDPRLIDPKTGYQIRWK